MRRGVCSLVSVIVLLAGTVRADVDYWRLVGVLGIVRALAVDPSDASVIYAAYSNAGTHFGDLGDPVGNGIWKSTDGGTSWVPVNVGLTDLDTTSIAIDPSNPSVVYVGTLGGGVFKSVNGGASWTPRNTGLAALDVLTVAVDPVTPTTIHVGLRLGGAYRSLDGGDTWVQGTGLVATVWSIAIDPTSPTTLYAASTIGVRKSTNGGMSWSATGSLVRPASPADDGGPVFDVRAVVVDTANPSTVLAGTSEGAGVFRSTNGGASWSHASVGLRSSFGNWRFVVVLAQDPVTPQTFYLSSTRSTYRSIDGGDTWVVFNAGLSRGEAFGLTTQSSVGGVWIASVFGDIHRLDTKPSGADHFRCFRAKGRGFTAQTMTLTDPFAAGESATVLKPYRFCTPTSVSGEPITDPTTHLACYKLRRSRFPRTLQLFLSQRIDGYRAYYINRPETVCVSAALVGEPSAQPRDAYRCIRGRRYSNDTLDVTLADDLGAQEVRGTKVDRVCYPAELDGEPVLEAGVFLRCDKLLGARPAAAPSVVTIEDRFGTIELRLSKADSHCFPALESRD